MEELIKEGYLNLNEEEIKRKPKISPETRKKISLLNSGRNNGMFGKVPWNKGKHPEYLQGENHPFYGRHHSSKSKKRISKIKKELYLLGKITPWNKGKSFSKVERTCVYCKKKFMVIPSRNTKFCNKKCLSNYNLKKKMDYPNGKFSKNCIQCNKKFFIRYKKSNRKFCSRTCCNNIRKGKKLSNKQTAKWKEWRKRNLIIPIKDTSIEIKIQNFLKQLNITFLTHQYMEIEHAYQCDILIPSMNLVIECDGDWWHGNKKIYPYPTEWQLVQIEKDKIRTQELKEAGFNVLRLWEHEIRKLDIESFKERLDGRSYS